MHSNNNSHAANGSDTWISILAAILLSKAAIATFSMSPFLIGTYIDHVGLSARQASQLLSIEIICISISNVIAALFWIHRANCRSWARTLLFVAMGLNLLCIVADSFSTLLMLRAAIGITEGSLLAIGFGLLGATHKPDRNFGFTFAASLTIGAVNVRIMPLYLESSGATGLFINLALYSVVALLLSQWLARGRLHESRPHSPAEKGPGLSSAAVFPFAALIFLVIANYVYFIGQGGVWSFMERWGLQQDLHLENIAIALSLALVAGVSGGLTAAWLDLRLGRLLPMAASIILPIIAIFVLRYSEGFALFVIAACVFNFMNNFGHPYILGLASSIDKSSRLTVLSGALHTGGQATGPFLVGMLVTDTDFSNALWVGMAAFSVTLFILVPVMMIADRTVARQTAPAA